MTQLTGVMDFLGINQQRESRGSLNLVAAAEAHVLWKTRLGHHVAGNLREPLESAPLGQDGICQLGNWINGSVLKPFCKPELLQQLSMAHQQFHQLGANIVELLKSGDRKGAAAVFDNEYSQSLRDIIVVLAKINKRQQEL